MPGTTSSLLILTQRSSQRPTLRRKGSCQQSRRQRNLDGLARAAQQQTLLTTVRMQACSHWSENVGFRSPCQSAVTMLVLSVQTHDWQGHTRHGQGDFVAHSVFRALGRFPQRHQCQFASVVIPEGSSHTCRTGRGQKPDIIEYFMVSACIWPLIQKCKVIKSVPWGPHCGVKRVFNIDFEAVLSRQLDGKISRRSHHKVGATLEGSDADLLEEADPSLWNAARLKCTFEGRKPRCSFGQETAEAACSQYANAVGTLEESDELGHALETWSDATAQYWASSGRVGQLTLSGKFAKFRIRPVLGETFMPLGCVILEGGGNAELRAWKPFGQWINTIRKASLVTDPPEHARYAARKIVNFIQGSDTPSVKVMDDLSATERWSLVEECTLLVLSFLKREGSGAQCYMLTERVRRLAERALQKRTGVQQTCNTSMVKPSAERRRRPGPQMVWERRCTP